MSRTVSIVAVVILALLAGAFFWIRHSPFPKAFELDGRPFERIDVVGARGTSNVFYTPRGQSRETALEFVQLIAFDDDIPEDNRRLSINYQHKLYALKEKEPDSNELFGTFKRGGANTTAWGTVLGLKKGSALIVHVMVQDVDFDAAAAEATTPERVAALRALTATFNR